MYGSLSTPTLDPNHRTTGRHTCFQWSFPPYMILQMELNWAFLIWNLSWKGFQYYHTAFGSWVADCSFACQPRRPTKLSNGCARGPPPEVFNNAPALHAFDDIDIIGHVNGRYTLTDPTSLHNTQCLSLPEMSGRSDARLTCLYCTRRYSRKSVSVSCDVTRVDQRC
jgi:hypothetical protein